TEVYQYEEALVSFVNYLNEGKDGLHDVVSFSGTQEEIEMDFAFKFTVSYSENIDSFVNHVHINDDKTDDLGSRTSITRTFNEYARRLGFLKENDKNLDGGDLREGLTAVISVRVPEALLQFEGQTKGRLGTPEVRSAVDKIVAEKLSFFLQENSKIANDLVTKA